jgi:hypothetical protein
MDDTQTPTELKQEASDVTALPPANSDATTVVAESQAPASQGVYPHPLFFLSSVTFRLAWPHSDLTY